VRLFEWLRHGQTDGDADGGKTPRPVLRLKHLLNMLERNRRAAGTHRGAAGPLLARNRPGRAAGRLRLHRRGAT
jgi:hypothetical protein